MRRLLCIFAVALTANFSATADASVTVDIGANLPAAMGQTNTLADGTTITINEFTGGPTGGLGSAYPNGSASDFSFSGNGVGNNGTGGDWTYVCVDVDFGTDFGLSMDGVVSAADFSLGVSSLNGSSNWYEFGFIDLHGPAGSISQSQIQAYLANTSNYTSVNTATEIGTVLGADAANDAHNNGGAGGSSGSGSENTNDTWDNNDFGLNPATAITGFSFYYGAVTSDDRSSSPGGSIGSAEDAMTTQGVPEPGSVAIILGLVGATCLRRRR